MKITSIKQQVKRSERYSIFIDGKYSFSLSELALINSELKPGQTITRYDLVKLKEESDFDKAYNRVLNLLARRARSEWEIRDYLKRKKYTDACTGSVLVQLKDRGYTDDFKFAQAWVENRRLLKNTSKRRLTQELRQKRVSDEIIDEVMGMDETDELEVLKELVAKKRQQTRYKDDTKLTQYLIRQGYNYADIKAVLSENTP